MATSTTWLSLKELGRIFGISPNNWRRVLIQHGWQDPHGLPTAGALAAGAVQSFNPHNPPLTTLWNSDLCKKLLEQSGYQPISRNDQIEQWTRLFEALEEGSPSINTTAEEMAEDLPNDLAKEVNISLAQRGCHFRVTQCLHPKHK